MGYSSRYACAPLPPDPSGLSTSGGSARSSSQPALGGVHLIHNRWPGAHLFAIWSALYPLVRAGLCALCSARPVGRSADHGLLPRREPGGGGRGRCSAARPWPCALSPGPGAAARSFFLLASKLLSFRFFLRKRGENASAVGGTLFRTVSLNSE